MRAPSTGAIPTSGRRRQATLDAHQEAFARYAEYQIRYLVAVENLDVETATSATVVALEVLVGRAVDTGRARLVRKAAVARLMDEGAV